MVLGSGAALGTSGTLGRLAALGIGVAREVVAGEVVGLPTDDVAALATEDPVPSMTVGAVAAVAAVAALEPADVGTPGTVSPTDDADVQLASVDATHATTNAARAQLSAILSRRPTGACEGATSQR